MKEKLIVLLTFTSSLKSFGMKFIRIAILVVFVWIGGLKYFHYEADGIVPFVANSPFMSFFYAKGAPEYKEHKNAEGAFVPEIVHGTKQTALILSLTDWELLLWVSAYWYSWESFSQKWDWQATPSPLS